VVNTEPRMSYQCQKGCKVSDVSKNMQVKDLFDISVKLKDLPHNAAHVLAHMNPAMLEYSMDGVVWKSNPATFHREWYYRLNANESRTSMRWEGAEKYISPNGLEGSLSEPSSDFLGAVYEINGEDYFLDTEKRWHKTVKGIWEEHGTCPVPLFFTSFRGPKLKWLVFSVV